MYLQAEGSINGHGPPTFDPKFDPLTLSKNNQCLQGRDTKPTKIARLYQHVIGGGQEAVKQSCAKRSQGPHMLAKVQVGQLQNLHPSGRHQIPRYFFHERSMEPGWVSQSRAISCAGTAGFLCF